MKDPLPTKEDIRRVLLKQQRKKNVVPYYAVLTNKYNSDILQLRQTINSTSSTANRQKLESQLRIVLKAKQDFEDQHCENLKNQVLNYIINQKKSIRLKSQQLDHRRITTFNKPSETLLTFDRYCAEILRNYFQIKTAGRDQSIRVLLDSLKVAASGKISIRTIHRFDIADFYDSIEHKLLAERINTHQGIPRFVKIHINALFEAYQRIYGTSKGIPQGIPISAALAEIYLQDLDEKIRRDPHVALYIRYVDDIVVISDRKKDSTSSTVVTDALQEIGLVPNKAKSDTIYHPSEKDTTMNFLGYEIVFSGGSSNGAGSIKTIDISKDKKDRYKKALDNIDEHIGKNPCWAQPGAAVRFISLFQYLLMPHVSSHEYDGYRIVTGLAYSAKFIENSQKLGKNKSSYAPKNIRDVISSAHHIYKSKLNITPVANEFECNHCSQRVPIALNLTSIDRCFDYFNIMFGEPLPHVEDKLREDIRRILWN